MSTAARIRTAARACGYSQAMLAAATGLRLDTVNRLWNGANDPGLGTARRLARALGVTVHHLYHGEDR